MIKKVCIRAAGGNASKNSTQSTINLSVKEIEALGVTKEDRYVKVSIEGNKVIIEKV